MTDIQVYTIIAVAIPLVVNGICFTAVFIMLNWTRSRIDRLEDRILTELKEIRNDIKDLKTEKRII